MGSQDPRAPLVNALPRSIEGSDLQDGLTIPNSMHPKIRSYRPVGRFAASNIVACDGTLLAIFELLKFQLGCPDAQQASTLTLYYRKMPSLCRGSSRIIG